MKLDVLPNVEPWYADGLKFTCTQCGNCCTGGPGFVWISDAEVQRLAEFLKLAPSEVLGRYCRKVDGRWSLKERRTSEGLYDCIFLTQASDDAAGKPRQRQLKTSHPVPLRPRGCSIYPVRPLQCRTWPFWDSTLKSPGQWDRASRRCPGMNRGKRTFTPDQIDRLRTATDWPDNPPGSSG